MILTVTSSPSIDKTILVPDDRLGAIHLSQTMVRPGTALCGDTGGTLAG